MRLVLPERFCRSQFAAEVLPKRVCRQEVLPKGDFAEEDLPQRICRQEVLPKGDFAEAKVSSQNNETQNLENFLNNFGLS